MKLTIKKHINNLKLHGITKIPNAVSKKKCDNYVKKANQIIDNFVKKKIQLNSTCQIIKNPFNSNKIFLELIYHPTVDQILKNLLNETYALINTSLINRKKINIKNSSKEIIGKTWHHDSRIINDERLPKGIFYIAWLLLNDYTDDNCSTLYVPNSHKVRKPGRPKRNFNYKYKKLKGERGTIFIIDAGLWHKGGEATKLDRWLSASYYGPWFVKPYYEYPKMKNIINCKNKKIQKLMHLNYWPRNKESYSKAKGTLPKKYQRY